MDNAEFTWLHLSDFHIGKDEYAQGRALDHILTEIKRVSETSRKPDLIFITGDLANKGLEREFEIFDKEFLIPLIEQLGDRYLSRVFIIPGNHDVDRSQSKSVMRHGVLAEIKNFLDPSHEGQEERQLLLKRFRTFDEYQWYLDYVRWISSAEGYHASRVVLGKCEVGILSINTSWFCGGNDEQFKLTPGVGMVEQGLGELKGCVPLFVLGHHPLEWINPTDAKRIRAMLTQAGAIYLHGHLHKSEHTASLSGALPLIALQAGCAFFARDDEKWTTRLLWGGYELDTRSLLMRPVKWDINNHEWALDADAFANSLRREGRDYWVIPTQFSVPGEKTSLASPATRTRDVSPPEGWVLIDSVFLAERKVDLSQDRLLQYFEGRVPQWEDILSGGIPARAIVDDLFATVIQGFEAGEPRLTLLLGAGGEGKSTAFLQTLEKLSRERPIKMLWRTNPEKGLPPQFVTSLAGTRDIWLIATDEGDSLIADIYNSLRGLNGKSNVHFFVTCRDTDWIENRGNDFAWNQVVSFMERRMKGLDEPDARAIVDAWSKLGSRGLGKLSGLETEEAVSRLLEAARLEATTSEGAFLGAMLRVRVGMALTGC